MSANKLITLGLVITCVLLIWEKFAPGQQASTKPASTSGSYNADDNSTQALLQRIQTLEADLSNELLQRQAIERRLSKLEDTRGVAARSKPSQPLSAVDDPQADEVVTQDDSLSLGDRLLSAGLPAETIDAMQQTVDRNRLAMLQLRDRAVREGWNDTQEFSEKMNELRDAGQDIRQQFGDQLYDQYLYASGRPNRIVVREVYSGSAAEFAGLQPGDIILSYASSNIYSMSELRQSTVEGNAGEVVLLEIRRADSPISTSVPRGPLGISMSTTRIQP